MRCFFSDSPVASPVISPVISPVTSDMVAARKYFPRGLSQPEQGHRFSLDALLLACFLETKKGWHVADIGTGCGVVGLALLVGDKTDSVRVTGIDNNTALLEHARANASALGFADRFTPLYADVAVSSCQINRRKGINRGKGADRREGADREEGTEGTEPLYQAESMAAVVCNPPYRNPATGRLPDNPGKRAARFTPDTSLESFVYTASYLVQNKGSVAFVGLAERLAELLSLFSRFRLTPKQVQMVHSRHDSPAKRVLICGIKNAAPGLVVRAPLILYQDTELTQAAVDFCPFLACNRTRDRG